LARRAPTGEGAKEDLTDAEKCEIRKLVAASMPKTSNLGRRLVAGLNDALAHARGEMVAAELRRQRS